MCIRDSIQAVRSITFHVTEGEMVALIGANGAGKTSTLKAVARALDAAGGDVHFCGEKITRIPVSYTHLDVYKRQARLPAVL